MIGSCSDQESVFEPGNISGSQHFTHGIFHPEATDITEQGLVTIESDNVVLDFNGLVIDARDLYATPDQFKGIAVRIENCKNVEIRNLTIHGFRYAINAENVDDLKLINCDFSYNYRPRLYSKWDRESLNDWLYFHDNKDWPKYAGAVFLKNCQSPLIKGITIQQGFNGIMMDGCNNGLVYNNNIRFNSGLGIGMYESSHNRIMHNRLDWNVRGYSHGKYDRGQDSAGILLYEQCNNNTIAYNSATHSGDGVFLWAGQYTMDTGKGGCNGNLICRNDFSHSVANGVEATFSSNIIVENKLNDCRYGIWGGYSHHSIMSGNTIEDCDHGISVEHGNHIIINDNIFKRSPSGIELWERPEQPAGWGFAEKRNVSSRTYEISSNTFEYVSTAITLTATDSVYLSENTFNGVETKIKNDSQSGIVKSLHAFNINNDIAIPPPLPDGMDTELEAHYPRGRKYILVNEWGPYNFAYPDIFLRRRGTREDAPFDHTFALFGPVGNWKLIPGARGIDAFRPKSGATPTTIELRRSADSSLMAFDLSYLGPTYIDQFGDTVSRGDAPDIKYISYRTGINWKISYYNYPDTIPPAAPNKFVSENVPVVVESRDEPALTFWRAPADGVNADYYLTYVTGSGLFEQGRYAITFEADDGAQLVLDGRVLTDSWSDPNPDEIMILEVDLEGEHTFEIYHYELGGLSVIDFDIEPVSGPSAN